MSRIDDLIRQHCPNGIEFRAIGEISELVRGNGLPKTDFADAGVGCIHYGQIYTYYGTWTTHTISFISPEKAAKLAKVDPGDLIVTNTSENVEDVCKSVAWLGEEQIVTGGHATVLKHDQDPKYLAYYLQTAQFHADKKRHATGTKVIDVSAKRLAKIRIPVPPLEVQAEIVRVLDLFQSLEAELEAELEARRRQYAHYRDLLVRVDRDGSDIAWATLPEVAKNLDSQRRPVTKSAREPGPYPYYGASGVVDHVNGYIFDGDYLLVSEDGANLLARSSPIAFSSSGKVWVNNHAHVLQFPSYAERRYVEIYLNSIDLAPWVAGGAQPKLNQANLNRIPIPRPSLPEQQRIVAILDRFDALVNDLSVGLPAELVARRRQYEYYRDRLLSFEEAA
ncbi:MAG: restriction endonuclease subunit S [Microthrixaceae bacterium]|nr:restriction endonuclease subunit S [Microthrixaceae bacterium]